MERLLPHTTAAPPLPALPCPSLEALLCEPVSLQFCEEAIHKPFRLIIGCANNVWSLGDWRQLVVVAATAAVRAARRRQPARASPPRCWKPWGNLLGSALGGWGSTEECRGGEQASRVHAFETATLLSSNCSCEGERRSAWAAQLTHGATAASPCAASEPGASAAAVPAAPAACGGGGAAAAPFGRGAGWQMAGCLGSTPGRWPPAPPACGGGSQGC